MCIERTDIEELKDNATTALSTDGNVKKNLRTTDRHLQIKENHLKKICNKRGIRTEEFKPIWHKKSNAWSNKIIDSTYFKPNTVKKNFDSCMFLLHDEAVMHASWSP